MPYAFNLTIVVDEMKPPWQAPGEAFVDKIEEAADKDNYELGGSPNADSISFFSK